MLTKPVIENPNSSGQGYHISHLSHPLHATAVAYYYKYSHSTPIGYADGWFLLHTYQHRDNGAHTISLKDHGFEDANRLFWSTSCGGGTKYGGYGVDDLKLHLVRKAKRYGLYYGVRFDGYVVTGKTRDGKRFVKQYGTDGCRWAMGINLWNGSVWGVKNNKRTLLKRVCN